MKKIALIIPVGLVVLSSAAVLALEYYKPEPLSAIQSVENKTPADIFAMNEHLMRQIIRYGDKESLENFHQSLNQLDGFLEHYGDRGLDTSKTDELVLQYVQDSIKVSEVAPEYMEKLASSHQHESINEKKFLASLEQIGLYELKDGFTKLEKSRLEYLKDPKAQNGDEYLKRSEEVKQIIAELYLDSAIESPLYEYLDNHRLYFKTVAHMYQEIGEDKIARLRTNGYAIKAQLQLLPKV